MVIIVAYTVLFNGVKTCSRASKRISPPTLMDRFFNKKPIQNLKLIFPDKY
jgi:hypothetical protein